MRPDMNDRRVFKVRALAVVLALLTAAPSWLGGVTGVMAHEMSHVYMQHSAKAATKEGAAQVGLGVLGAILGNGTAGTLARTGIQLGAGAYFLHYSRSDEAQADSTGAIIMYKAGYDPKAMAQFFQKLEQQGGARA